MLSERPPEPALAEQLEEGPYSSASQCFTDYGYCTFSAEDLVNAEPWEISRIIVGGGEYSSDPANASAFRWYLYADAGGQPGGVPGDGLDVWNLSLSPGAPGVTIDCGARRYARPAASHRQCAAVPAGHWWLIFYMDMAIQPYGQWFWAQAATDENSPSAIWYGDSWNTGSGGKALRVEAYAGPQADIPWLSEDPTGGTVIPGDETSVAVTFTTAGLAPGSYAGGLLVQGNDFETPRLLVPVSLTALDPAHGAGFTWLPAGPNVGQQVTFRGTGEGSEPIQYEWGFGDGDTGIGSVATHTYAAKGTYQVTLTIDNGCGQQSVTQAITVTEPDIDVSPVSLSATLCPDTTTTQTLQVCNTGDGALTWILSEMAGERKGRPEGILWDQSTLAQNTGHSDMYTVDGWSDFSADDFVNLEPWSIESIFVPGAMWWGSMSHASALHWCIYPDAGGVPAGHPLIGGEFWCWSTSPDDPAVTIGGQYNGDVTLDLVAALGGSLAVPSGSWWLLFFPEFASFEEDAFYWYFGTTENGQEAQFIDPMDHWGGGHEGWVSWRVQAGSPDWPHDLAFRIDGQVAADSVSWLREEPLGGSIPPGECRDVTVTFDSAGLAPGQYSAGIQVSSNDPDESQVTVPADLEVLEPLHDLAFTWDPAMPSVGQPTTFTGSAQGSAPIVFTWAFDSEESLPDGLIQGDNPVVHVYDAPGDHLVSMSAWNVCGGELVQNTVTVRANWAPDARDDSATTATGKAVLINATANDVDPDGNLDPTTAAVVTVPAHGTVVNNGNGTFTYSPTSPWTGTDSFTYRVCDTFGMCDTATVTIQVTSAVPSLHVGNILMGAMRLFTYWKVSGEVPILNNAGRPVSGALVYATWTLPNGTTTSQVVLTNLLGKAKFLVSSKQTGTYRVCVTNVIKSGYRYDPLQNYESCDTKTVP